ncbi:hypothetical protein SAMN05444157_1332 [Frankineae bacterium MT45]|nr:hypothetical protein SAMN05444157_1332 [Frankineae bacterium MT45]
MRVHYGSLGASARTAEPIHALPIAHIAGESHKQFVDDVHDQANRLLEPDVDVVGFNGGTSPIDKEQFIDVLAERY